MLFPNLAKQTKLILATGIIIACIGFILTWNQRQKAWFNELEQEALEDTLILSGELEVVKRELMGIISLYDSSQFVTWEDFQTYVEPILKNHNFIRRFEWVPKVTHSERSVYERSTQTNGIERFRFLSRNSKGSFVTREKAKEYYPIFYIEPFQGNESLLGFDLSTQSDFFNYLTESRDAGKPLATQKIQSPTNSENSPEISIVAPFYGEKNISETPEARKKALKGFVIGVYRIKDMIEQMVSPYLAKGMSLSIYQTATTEEKNKLYGEPLSKPALEIKNVVNIAGRRWLLVWQATKFFKDGSNKSYAFWVAGSIFAFFIFISIIFEMMASRTRVVEKQVKTRTEELTDANIHLKHEIAAREQAEKKQQAAKEEAELANRAKSVFLANMSHEIRTPMNAILGYAQLLERQIPENSEPQKQLKKILNSGDHLLQIINDILQLSKIEAGKMELVTANFDLSKLVKDIVTIIRPLCQEKNLVLNLEANIPSTLWVHGDEIKIKQALINLLGNAVKFTDIGSASFRIDSKGKDVYGFEVEDTGRGIAQEYRQAIFDPFDQGQDIKKSGTGLGLAIFKKQIELMKGTWGFESEPGKGSRFYFELQLPEAAGKVDAKTTRIPAKIVNGNRKIVALVADDNELGRDILSKALEEAGIKVWTASNGEQAVELTLSHKPNIVFMDLRMPQKDGYEALKCINDQQNISSIKFVAVTAWAFEDQRQKCLAAGFDDFISKPFRLETVFESLSNLLEVELDFSDTALSENPESIAGETEPLKIAISEKLLTQLKEAAKLHDITDFKKYFKELENSEIDEKKLSELIRPHLEQYNMDAILTILAQLEHESKT